MIYTVFFDTDSDASDVEMPQDFETYDEALAYAQEIIKEGRANNFIIQEA